MAPQGFILVVYLEDNAEQQRPVTFLVSGSIWPPLRLRAA